jgi:hypothetical protein
MNRHLFIIASAAAMGLLILFFVYDAKDNFFLCSYRSVCSFGLYIGGFLLTMTIFSNIHDEKKGPAWHTLPASLLEKFSSRLVLVTIGFTCGWYLSFFLVMVISEGLLHLLSWQSRGIYNPLNGQGLAATARFWIFQSVFACGAIYFRKHAPVKTLLAIAGYGAFLMLVVIFTEDICLGKYISEVNFSVQSTGMYAFGGQMDREMAAFFRSETALQITSASKWISNIAFLCVVMPLYWGMAYARLREMEV